MSQSHTYINFKHYFMPDLCKANFNRAWRNGVSILKFNTNNEQYFYLVHSVFRKLFKSHQKT
jgi:hypothetical protein